MADLLAIHRHAVRVRLTSERLTQLARAGRTGFHPEARGFEPAIAAAVLAMRADDYVFPSAREHAVLLVRDMPIARYVASAFGSAEDPANGHAAPGHLSSRELKVGSPSGMVSNHLTHATGLAWAARLRKDDVAVLTLFGESAADAGEFHSAVNFAGAIKVPVVFLCRTDRTATNGAPSPMESVADKAIGYGIEGTTCSADDPESVSAAVARALAKAIAGEGPTLIEAIRESAADPIDALRAKLVSAGAWDASRDMQMRRELMGEIEAAVIRAVQSGPPPQGSMFADVYADLPSHLIEQRNELDR